MPSSKTDTAIRLPENEDQTRRLRNVTQDRKAISRMQNESSNSKAKGEDASSWSTEQLLDTGVNAWGNPEPDPVSYGDGRKAKINREHQRGDVDVVGAMNDRDFT